MTKRMTAALVATATLALTAACNTVEGAGEDIESVGQEIDEQT